MVRSMAFGVCCMLFVVGVGRAAGADDLLPPVLRHSEKRTLGAANERQSFYNGRGVSGAAFSPNGKSMITYMGYNGGSILWDVESGKMIGQLPNDHPQGMIAAFTPDGKHLVVSGSGNNGDCSVSLVDVAKREKIRSVDEGVNDTPFTALAVAPDGRTIALAAGFSQRQEPPAICFWDMASGDEISRLPSFVNAANAVRNRRGVVANPAQALAYSPNGRQLAILYEGMLVIVEVATNNERCRFTFHQASGAEGQGSSSAALAFSPDGRTLAAASSDGAVRRFDLRSRRELLPLPGQSAVVALSFTSDGKSLRSYGMDGQLMLWRADAGRDWKAKSASLTNDDLESLWSVLRSDDPLELYGCIEAMAANPKQTIDFLRRRVAPVAAADEAQVDRLVAQIMTGDYNARKRAVVDLRKIGAAAVPSLIKTQQQGGYNPLMQRLLFEFQNLPESKEQIQVVRATWALERIGDASARKVLEELAAGASEARLTIQAKSALERIGKNAAAPADSKPDALVTTMGEENAADAYRAMCALADLPMSALRDRLINLVAKDTFDDDPARIAKLIKELDKDKFKARAQARDALRPLARRIAPRLTEALNAKPGLEAEQALEELLKAGANPTPPREMLCFLRALETLELKGGADALQLVETIAKTAKGKWLRELATESLQRQGGTVVRGN